ncbi:MAG TPA: flagellar basal body P-ring protein FlgI [Vicinamibacterales bacterium]|nr:flagellar basal body P-ring protein FlgI [Vicinamibacterales bacterium]
MGWRKWVVGLVLGVVAGAAVATAAPVVVDSASLGSRLEDIASLQGANPIQLIGYGLVVGLNKTGDKQQTIFSAQTLANMLLRFGVVVPSAQIKVENVAAVMVTSELPPFVRPGSRLDVTASSIGDAQSLQGGTLLATPLRGPNGKVYAMAEGPLSIGGFGGGSGGNSVQVNHLTVGRVPGGGIVQVGQGIRLGPESKIMLALHDPDYMTAERMAAAISANLGPGSAEALDPATVQVKVPPQYQSSLANLMARLEPIRVRVDEPARVVINERTGTVVIGANVQLGPAAVAHGNLSVRISTKYEVSQPSPFSQTGTTQVVPNTKVDVQEGTERLIPLNGGTTLDAVVQSLNALGATPRDIIAILQALKAAGALHAEIVII